MGQRHEKCRVDSGARILLERRRVTQMVAGLAMAGASLTKPEAAGASTTKTTAIATVNRFLDAYWTLKPEPTLALVHEDFTWINMPMVDSPIYTVKGKEALRKVMTSGNGGFPEPIEGGEWKLVFALGDGGNVLHERVDRYKLRGKWFELPCNAHWVVDGGKVISWRDYFDFGTYVRQMESIGIKPPQ